VSLRRIDDQTLALEGQCGVDDAEALLQALLATPAAVVDWRGCEGAHTAVVQVLLAARARVRGPAASVFLSEMVERGLVAR
jgi:hypothetical protein